MEHGQEDQNQPHRLRDHSRDNGTVQGVELQRRSRFFSSASFGNSQLDDHGFRIRHTGRNRWTELPILRAERTEILHQVCKLTVINSRSFHTHHRFISLVSFLSTFTPLLMSEHNNNGTEEKSLVELLSKSLPVLLSYQNADGSFGDHPNVPCYW